MNNDIVNHPSHYASGNVECIECIESALSPEAFKGFLRGNIIKYVFRADKKGNAAQDYSKAEWYLRRLIEYERDENPHG